MSEQDNRRNARTGFFVLIGIIIFLVAIFFIGSARNLFNANITLYAFFTNVEGLQRGNNVWLSGVKVGTVKDVEIANDTLVRVSLKVRESEQRFINRDAVAFLGKDGLVGNSIVVIEPGTIGNNIKDGDTLSVKYNTSTEDLMQLAETAGDRILRLTENLADITDQIKAGQGTLGMLLSDTVLEDQIASTISGLQSTSQRASAITGRVNQLVQQAQSNKKGPVYTMLNDTSFARTYTNSLSNIRTSTQKVNEATTELANLAQKLNSEESAIGVLTQDEQAAADLQRTLDNAAAASRKLDQDLEALQHSFLLRGAFRRMERKREKARKDSLKALED